MKFKLRKWEHPRDTIFFTGMLFLPVGLYLLFAGYEKFIYMSVIGFGLFIMLIANIFFGGLAKKEERK